MHRALPGRSLGHAVLPLAFEPVMPSQKLEPGSARIHHFDGVSPRLSDKLIALLFHPQVERLQSCFQVYGYGNGLEGVDEGVFRDVMVDVVFTIV